MYFMIGKRQVVQKDYIGGGVSFSKLCVNVRVVFWHVRWFGADVTASGKWLQYCIVPACKTVSSSSGSPGLIEKSNV